MAMALLDPKLDLVFKMLFGREENRALLLSLLNAVLRLPRPIVSATVLNPDFPKGAVDQKGIVLDIRVALADGQQVDVEMQSQGRPARRERALYYWARMYSSQLTRGDDYQDLCRSVVVFILNFQEFSGERFHSTFRVREIHDAAELSNHLELHFLELPKLTVDRGMDEPLLGLWGKFLSASTKAQLEELAMADPVFQQAKSALERLSADPQARLLAEERETALKLYQVDLTKARKQSFAEGKAEGKAEGRAEVLLALLQQKFGDLPQAVRETVAGASEVELVSLTERLLAATSLHELFRN